MKKVLMAVILLSVMSLSIPAMALDGNNVFDNLGDLITGKGNSFLGGEVIKDFALPKSFFGIDKLGVKGWFDAEFGDYKGEEREYIGGVRLRVTL